MWKSLISSPQSLAHLALQTSTIHTIPKGYAAVARTLNASDLKAFINDGQQGVVLHPGTWHHGLVAVEVAKTRYLDLPAYTICQRGNQEENRAVASRTIFSRIKD